MVHCSHIVTIVIGRTRSKLINEIVAKKVQDPLGFEVGLVLHNQFLCPDGAMGVPESLLIDREGRVIERYVGPREWDAPEHVERLEQVIRADGA